MKTLEQTAKTPTGKVKWALFNSKTYTTILYLLLSLPLGILYFTIAITGLALSIALTPIFIGIPLFFGVAKLLNGIVKFEQSVIRQILALPAPSTPYAVNHSASAPNWFMGMVRSFDGPLFIRNFLLVLLRFVTGIVFFVIMVAVLSIGLGLIVLPIVHIVLMKEIQVDILAYSLFSYFNIDWTYEQQYMLYAGVGIVIFWIALRIVNGLMQVQRSLMYVDEPLQQLEEPMQSLEQNGGYLSYG